MYATLVYSKKFIITYYEWPIEIRYYKEEMSKTEEELKLHEYESDEWELLE